MDPLVQQGLIAGLSAVGGGAVTQAANWFFTRGDKKAEREQSIASANDKLAADLREEVRKDNLLLRERMATLEGQVIELNKTNESLRKENLELTRQNGQQANQLSVQAAQLDTQAKKIAEMQKTLDEQRDHNAALESAMKAANIPMPEVKRRTSDTGPLTGAFGAAD